MGRLLFKVLPLVLLLSACTPQTNLNKTTANQTASQTGNQTANQTKSSASVQSNATGAGVSAGATLSTQVYVTAEKYPAPSQDVTYPVLHGLSNQAVEAQINKLLKENSIFVPNQQYPSPSSYSYFSSYNVIFQQGDVMNFLLSSYFFPTGAAHGMPVRKSLIINIKTGDIYTLDDIFQAGSPYLSATSQVISEEDTNHVLDTFQKFTGVTNKDTIYLVPNGFAVDFSPYEWASYAQGFLDYEVPYDKVMGIINTEGSFWRALHDPTGFAPANHRELEQAKIQSLGYIPSTELETSTAVTNAEGQTLRAWVGARKTSNSQAQGQGNSGEEKVFFFLNGQYLGTDTLKDHGYVSNVEPNGRETIAVIYALPNPTGNASSFTINYHWTGSKLIPDGSFPADYKWTS